MYYIKREDWNRLTREQPDYTGRAIQRHEHNGKVCEKGEWTCFESLLPGAPLGVGTALVFQHIHFEIV